MEIVTVRQMYVVKSVTNVVNTTLDFQTAKVLHVSKIQVCATFLVSKANTYLTLTEADGFVYKTIMY